MLCKEGNQTMDTSFHMWAVLVAAVAQFVVGGIWYIPIFGKLWGRIHGFDALDKKTQAEMQKQMMPLLGVQLLMSVVTCFVLVHFLKALPEVAWYILAVWLWLGFIVPTQVLAVIFGGTDPRWIAKKLAVMAGGGLVCTLAGAWILHVFA